VVPDNAEDSLIVVLRCLRIEFYYYSSLRVGFYGAFSFREWENVGFVVEELECRWLITVIDNIQQPIGSRSELHFTKVNGFAGKANIRAVSLALNREVQLIATQDLDAIMCAWELPNDLRLVSNSYFAGATGHDCAGCLTEREWIVFAIIIYSFDGEYGLHLWVVSKLNVFGEGFSYC